MLWRGDQGENRPADEIKTGEIKKQKESTSNTLSREELLASDPQARAMYEKLRSLRSSVDAIKDSAIPEIEPDKKEGAKQVSTHVDTEAAERAVLNKAREEALISKQKEQEKARQKAIQIKQMEEASRRAEQKQREAALMKKRAAEAMRHVKRDKAAQMGTAEGILANHRLHEAVQAEKSAEQIRTASRPTNGNVDKANSGEDYNKSTLSKRELKDLKTTLEAAHEKQEVVIDKLSGKADSIINNLNERQQHQEKKLTEAQTAAKRERDKRRKEVKKELDESRAKRIREEREAKAKQKALEEAIKRNEAKKKGELKAKQSAEMARIKAEKAAAAAKLKADKAAAAAKLKQEKRARAAEIAAAHKAEELRIKEERKERARQLWRERDEKRQAKRRQKKAEKLREAEEKLRIHQEIERYRQQRKAEEAHIKLQRIREEDAAKGGGIVTVHDVEIKTEINKRENISLWDLFGFKTKAERKAQTDEERMALRLEREYRREDARAKFSFNRMISIRTWQNSPLGRAVKKLEKYCSDHTKGILTVASTIATIFVIVASAISYWSAYEYSYNGTPMGIVNNKDDVLAVTNLVEKAVSKDNENWDVVISPDDIAFKRVWLMGDPNVDSSEEVLNRLTYMSDVKVESYGIFVDGDKVGAVQNRKDAQNVLESLKQKYTSKMERSEVEEAVFLEKVDIDKCSTKLGNVMSAGEMVDYLTADTNKETIHSAVTGETVDDIAKVYGTTPSKILKDNSKLRKNGSIDAGTPVVIKETAPIVTVLITEKVSYTEDIKYKTETTKSDKMYEGDKKITQQGHKGEREITARLTSSNGNVINEENLITEVTKEPVTKEVTIGTKERPPTIGDGKFSNPIHDTYHLTTSFEMRWGRFHKGVDLACPTGTKVYAADGGTVTIASYKPSYGNLVVIDHQNGYTTKYAHNSKILVNVGDKVYEGQLIALVGSTGNSTGPHSHFEVRYHDVPKNPFNYIKH